MCSSSVSNPTGMAIHPRARTPEQRYISLVTSGDGSLGGGFRGGKFRHLEKFQNVADFHVVEICDDHTAFKARTHFAGVVLEPLQRAELRRVNERAVAYDAHLRVAPPPSILHVAARHCSRALDAECVAHFRT